jgi:hypothetical protein
MIDILLLLAWLFGDGEAPKFERPKPKPEHICEKQLDDVDLKYRIEIGMGCSTVNGARVYTDAKIERLYKEGKKKFKEQNG